MFSCFCLIRKNSYSCYQRTPFRDIKYQTLQNPPPFLTVLFSEKTSQCNTIGFDRCKGQTHLASFLLCATNKKSRIFYLLQQNFSLLCVYSKNGAVLMELLLFHFNRRRAQLNKTGTKLWWNSIASSSSTSLMLPPFNCLSARSLLVICFLFEGFESFPSAKNRGEESRQHTQLW